MGKFTSNHDTAPALRSLSPEATDLIVRIVPPGDALPLEVRDTFTPDSQNATGALYAGHRGFLVRLLPFLIIWGGLAAGIIWRFGTNPAAFLAFALLTGVVFWFLLKQDYSHSPAGERKDARHKLAKLKAQEMAQNYKLQSTVVKSTTRTK